MMIETIGDVVMDPMLAAIQPYGILEFNEQLVWS
jgi:hypothetical protein